MHTLNVGSSQNIIYSHTSATPENHRLDIPKLAWWCTVHFTGFSWVSPLFWDEITSHMAHSGPQGMGCDLQFLHVAFADFYDELRPWLVKLFDEMGEIRLFCRFMAIRWIFSQFFLVHSLDSTNLSVKILTCNNSNFQQSIPLPGCTNCSSTMSPTEPWKKGPYCSCLGFFKGDYIINTVKCGLFHKPWNKDPVIKQPV